MKLLIDICTVLCRILNKLHRLAYTLLADLNIGHYVELTFLECKLGRFLILTFLIWSFFKTYCILKVKVKKDSTQMTITWFVSLYHKISTELDLKKGQLDTMTYV